MQKRHLLSFVLTAAIATSASAAGYQLQEYSITGLGRAFAGAGVMGDDYSAVAFNPAGMSLMDKSGVQMGATAVDVYGTVKGESTTSLGTKEGRTHSNLFRVLPHFYGQKKVNDKLDLGIGLYVPFGLANDYKNGWFGEEHAGYSGITVVDLTPSVSYKILDSLAVGFGVNLQYAVAHLTGASTNYGGGYTDMHDADDMGVGYNVGFVWKPTQTTRLGLSYRSKVKHKLQGKNHLTFPLASIDTTAKVDAKITTPETVIFSAAQDLGDKWTLSGIARYTRWSRFDKLNIYQNGTKASTTDEHWKNTWLLGVGADYKPCKNLTFRFGTAWDNTAVRSPQHRTARIPDERRIWTSLGASYTKNNWQFDVG
ncbi:MAG: outer membrane protein transport protein, partial [Elusimicrobiaceae bacterium]|nr:outer membrane protein transport protein [Elusimicrobiaceae bacterium]